MKPVNIHEAKTHFSRLVERAASGETIAIARAGTPVALLVPLDAVEPAQRNRTGFLVGRLSVPDDFDRMAQGEIETQFDGLARSGPARSGPAQSGPQ
jgi:prevent-host-death family protein